MLEDQGGVCFDLKEGSSSSEVGGDTLVGRGGGVVSQKYKNWGALTEASLQPIL